MIGKRTRPKYQSIKGLLDRVDASEAAETMHASAAPATASIAGGPHQTVPQRMAPAAPPRVSPALLMGAGLGAAVVSGGLLALLVASSGDGGARTSDTAADHAAARSDGTPTAVARSVTPQNIDVNRFAASATALSGFKLVAKAEQHVGVSAQPDASANASPTSREPMPKPTATTIAANTGLPPANQTRGSIATEQKPASAVNAMLTPAAPADPQTAKPLPKPPRIAQAPPANPPSISPERMAALIAKGNAAADAGDIAGARLMFERAADGGSAAAAQLMAESYDPAALQRRGVIGLVGDSERARLWYERAVTLREQQSADSLPNAR